MVFLPFQSNAFFSKKEGTPSRLLREGVLFVQNILASAQKENLQGIQVFLSMSAVFGARVLHCISDLRRRYAQRNARLRNNAEARLDPNFKDGRPRKYSPAQLQHALELLEQGKTYRQVKELTGISKSTLVRARKS